ARAGLRTDAAGALRVPAALCGVVALRPTLGAVPTAGMVALAWSYDVVGPVARTVEDTAILWSVLAGGEAERRDTRLPRVGILDELLAGTAHPVSEAVRKLAVALDAQLVELEQLSHSEAVPRGAALVETKHLAHAEAVHTIVFTCEASAYHQEWFAREREHYSQVVRERLDLGP